MDPVTLAVVALTAIATRATERVGEELGESAIEAARRLLSLLQRRSPKILKQLEAAPTVESNEPIDVEIIEQELRQAVESDSEVRAAVEETAEAMQQQFGTVINRTKLAEKIGLLIQGGNNPITIGTLNV